MFYCSSCLVAVLTFLTAGSPSQPFADDPSQLDDVAGNVNNNQLPEESKRILGIIPNVRTSPTLQNHKPLTVSEKFKVASEDAFDLGTVGLAAIFGAEGQLTNANRSLGRGGAGFGRHMGTSYGDLVIGHYMTAAIFPALFRQDTRYFRRGTGSGWSRLGYAVGQVFWTQNDSGNTGFNYSEILGNATAVAISNAYYVDNRNPRDGVSKFGTQLGVDMAANILKEFWPDLGRKLKRKRNSD